jgi:hypothetical protein
MTAASPAGTPANVQRQIHASAREAWMREFREQAATLLATRQLLRRRYTAPHDPMDGPKVITREEERLRTELNR